MLIILTLFWAPGGPPKYPQVLCGNYFAQANVIVLFRKRERNRSNERERKVREREKVRERKSEREKK